MHTIKMPDGRIIELPSSEEEKVIARHMVEDDSPEWTEKMFAEAKTFEASDLPDLFKQSVRSRGRPRKANPKQPIYIRFSPEVLEYFRTTGRGWQTRMDEVLKEYVESQR